MSTAELYARVGTIDITPGVGLRLGGRESARVGRWVHSSLELNVVVLTSLTGSCCFVSVDSLYAGKELTNTIIAAAKQYFDIPKSCVVVAASHTHSAPNIDESKPRLGPVDVGYRDVILTKVTKTLRQLSDAPARPVEIFAGVHECHAAVSRRRFWPVPRLGRRGLVGPGVTMAPSQSTLSDPFVRTMSLVDVNQREEICCIWSYACHPTGLPYADCFSADYVGEVRGEVRRSADPGCAVLFLQGFSGDVRPPSRTPTAYEHAKAIVTGPRFYQMSAAEWRGWASEISMAVITARNTAQRRTASECFLVGGGEVELPLSTILPSASAEKILTWKRLAVYAGQSILAVNAEPLNQWIEIVARKKQKRDQWCVGCEGDVFGYLPTSRTLVEGGYEAEGFKRSFGVNGAFVSVPEEICGAKLAEQESEWPGHFCGGK